MIKTIDDITFMGSQASFTLRNDKNNAFISYNVEKGNIQFRDSVGNTMQNFGSTISINFKVFKLATVGETIRSSDGTIIAYLSSNDVQELAHKTFYEEGQTHVFDFVNLKFNVALE
jgi:hypothetical protein